MNRKVFVCFLKKKHNLKQHSLKTTDERNDASIKMNIAVFR